MAFIDVDSKQGEPEAIITVSGLSENVKKAQEMIQEFITLNYIEKIEIDTSLMGSVIIGKSGDIIKKLKEELEIEIEAENDKKNVDRIIMNRRKRVEQLC